jgi:RimJ/RimL family protein N-acetyltransferase
MTRFSIRRFRPDDAAAYRDLRLEALVFHPEAFSASFATEQAQSLAWHAARLERQPVFGGSLLPDDRPAGMVGLFQSDAPKIRHKATIWGMYLQPPARGSGLAAALVEHALSYAAGVAEEARLSVMSCNDAAIRLYRRLGFVQYGIEPRALKVAGRFHDEILMARTLGRP